MVILLLHWLFMDIPQQVLEPHHFEFSAQRSAKLIGITIRKHVYNISLLQLEDLVYEIFLCPVLVQLTANGAGLPLI